MTLSPHTPREGDVRTASQLSGERIGWADWEMKKPERQNNRSSPRLLVAALRTSTS